MPPYQLRKLFLRLIISLPVPSILLRFLRFFIRTKAGENFGDISINGELRFLKVHAPACITIFDVGAHVGTWTQHALSINPEAQIHCFEPMPDAFEQLQARNFGSNVTCNRVGLSSTVQEAALYTKSMSLYDKRMPGHEPSSEPISVKLSTLGVYCRNNNIDMIDLLKVDAEGHDYAILQGGRDLIEAGRIRRIQFEYGPYNIYAHVLLRDFFMFFEGLPYTLYQLMPKGILKVPTYDLRLENFVYKNFVALHDSVDARDM